MGALWIKIRGEMQGRWISRTLIIDHPTSMKEEAEDKLGEETGEGVGEEETPMPSHCQLQVLNQ